MSLRKYLYSTPIVLLAFATAMAQQDSPVQGSQKQAGHMQHMQMQEQSPAASTPADLRQFVDFPPRIYEHELWSMRDHLQTLQKIQDYLANSQYEKAADIAEQRLGMSSFKLHGAHESGKYMPKGMQEAGGAMHHSASRFALAATDVIVTGETNKVIAALADLTAKCVACHAAYRLR